MPEKLASQRVETIFMDCLFKDGEDSSDHIKAEGVITTVGFHPGRLASHKSGIEEMLGELPNEFHQSGPGLPKEEDITFYCQISAKLLPVYRLTSARMFAIMSVAGGPS